MFRHLGFAAIGSALFFIATLILLNLFDTGIQVEGYRTALREGFLFRNILVDISLLGAATGGLASIVYRKSVNQAIYVSITLVLTLAFLEFVLITILRSA